METVGSRIKNSRNRLGLTQSQLAEKLDVHRTTVALWETDKFKPERHSYLLADVLNVSPDWLLSGKALPSPESGARRRAAVIRALQLLSNVVPLNKESREILAKPHISASDIVRLKEISSRQSEMILEVSLALMLVFEDDPDANFPMFSKLMTDLQRSKKSSKKNK
jgi:transcriptional regulator with XRE-family HTH domain